MKAERLGYRPELDGLRAAACAAVFVHHAFAVSDQPLGVLRGGGWVGVTAFFTLSGYLITTLMLEEHERSGQVSLGGFYLRRARRLLPALLFLVAVWGSVAMLRHDDGTLQGAWYTLGYVGNLQDQMGWFGHSWSLAVEEHFYLAWPLVFLLARRRLLEVAVTLAGLSFLTRLALAVNGAEWWRLRNGDDTRAEAILVGCILAVLIHRGWRLHVRWQPLALGVVPFLFLGGYWWVAVVGYTSVAVLTAALIASWRTRPPATPKVLAGCGKVTYGFYLWHFPILLWLAHTWDLALPVFFIAGLVLSVAATWASWVLVERRWLSLGRDRLERRLDPGAARPVLL